MHDTERERRLHGARLRGAHPDGKRCALWSGITILWSVGLSRSLLFKGYHKTVGKPCALSMSKGDTSTRSGFTPDTYTICPFFSAHLPSATPNRDAAQLGRQTGVSAANIPGFILLGHADKIVNQEGGPCFRDVADAHGLLPAKTKTAPPVMLVAQSVCTVYECALPSRRPPSQPARPGPRRRNQGAPSRSAPVGARRWTPAPLHRGGDTPSAGTGC